MDRQLALVIAGVGKVVQDVAGMGVGGGGVLVVTGVGVVVLGVGGGIAFRQVGCRPW